MRIKSRAGTVNSENEARWDVTRFCGPLNTMLRNLDLTVFTKDRGSVYTKKVMI